VRAFVAWNPSDAEADALEALRDRVRSERDAPGYRWLRRAELHLTLRFLGEISEAQCRAISNGLASLAHSTPSFAAVVAGWQYWPDRRSPRVLVARVESRGELERIAPELEAIAREAGLAPERRPFRPHVTLARISRLERLPDAFSGPPSPIPLRIDHVALVQSELGPGGSRYTEIGRHAFAA